MKTRIRLAGAALVALLVVVLIVRNWRLFASRAELDFLFGRVEAPVGLVLMSIVLGLVGLQVMLLQVQKVMEHRRHGKELERTRAAATNQARSRTDALQVAVRREVDAIRSRLDQIDQALRDSPARDAP